MTRAVVFSGGIGSALGKNPDLPLLSPSDLLLRLSGVKLKRKPEDMIGEVHTGQPPESRADRDREWVWREKGKIGSKSISISPIY